MRRWWIFGGFVCSALASDEPWELPPLNYSSALATDPVTLMESRGGFRNLPGKTELEKMRLVLAKLGIPEASQILVFSKTSKQNDRINPRNPRSLFFSEDTYAGYVPGGDMEIVSQDPLLGAVYHRISLGGEGEEPVVKRETSDCLSCHGSARTENAPGVLVRSVFADADGRPLLALGGFTVDARTPLAERWGGYYVTGSSSLPHLGNRFFRADETAPAAVAAESERSLEGKIDVSKYPRGGSDIVALLVLEHQCRVNNLFIAATIRYRRMHWLGKALDRASDPDRETAGRLADEDAAQIVAALLFKEEASLGDGVEGDEAFQDAFTARFPKTRDGRSLADFHLGSRLFKNRCSYMVYSKAFRSLPERVRSAVIKRLRAVLDGAEAQEEFAYLRKSERSRISEILVETLPGFRS